MKLKKTKKRIVRVPENIQVRLSCLTINIPKEFKTDGASIPRIFWWTGWRPFDGDTILPAIVHDFLYRWHFPRLTADLIFLNLMETRRVSFLKRWTYFIGVRLFGHFKY
jgi:hypothetical protein